MTDILTTFSENKWMQGENREQHFYFFALDANRHVQMIRNKGETQWFAMHCNEGSCFVLPLTAQEDVNALAAFADEWIKENR